MFSDVLMTLWWKQPSSLLSRWSWHKTPRNYPPFQYQTMNWFHLFRINSSSAWRFELTMGHKVGTEFTVKRFIVLMLDIDAHIFYFLNKTTTTCPYSLIPVAMNGSSVNFDKLRVWVPPFHTLHPTQENMFSNWIVQSCHWVISDVFTTLNWILFLSLASCAKVQQVSTVLTFSWAKLPPSTPSSSSSTHQTHRPTEEKLVRRRLELKHLYQNDRR